MPNQTTREVRISAACSLGQVVGAALLVPQDPAPSEVDARVRHQPLAWHSVAVVLLAQAFHGAEVAVLERQLYDLRGFVLRGKLKGPCFSKGQRDDEHVLVNCIKQDLVIRMPANRLHAALVEVGIAGVWASFQATRPADGLRYLDEPRRHRQRIKVEATVGISAGAPLVCQPRRAPRQGEVFRRGAAPSDIGAKKLPPAAQQVNWEGILAVGNESPPVLIVQHDRQTPDCVTANGPGMPPPDMAEAAIVGSGGGVGFGLKARFLTFFRRLGLVLLTTGFRKRMRRRPLIRRAGEMLRLSWAQATAAVRRSALAEEAGRQRACGSATADNALDDGGGAGVGSSHAAQAPSAVGSAPVGSADVAVGSAVVDNVVVAPADMGSSVGGGDVAVDSAGGPCGGACGCPACGHG
eukprot:CAMPEP_0171176830 /NCGR_PEP_ID=MMETSP0790-20130122/11933_1 /TAXON_ID=2925 /ORGANISM="Alexandrium catenella, Strain OF101" /LENGTH=408 /DNA_ID=CAMNT_0011641723 /DNA_START=49 /DNA_END=1275 /DNA_ORIENTATION=+